MALYLSVAVHDWLYALAGCSAAAGPPLMADAYKPQSTAQIRAACGSTRPLFRHGELKYQSQSPQIQIKVRF